MSDSTSRSVTIPYNPQDKRALPEIVADYAGFPLAYVEHEPSGKRIYSVQDWILGVAQPTSHPGHFWVQLKNRLKKANIEFSPRCYKLPYVASDGKRYKMDFVDAELLYQITQRMDANTGIRNKVLEFLAKAGVVVDDIRIDPDKAIEAAVEAYRRQGKSEKWIQTRLMGKLARLYFTAAFAESLREAPQPRHYAIITDDVYRGLWNRPASVIKQQMKLKKNDNLRDHQSIIALSYQMLAENLSGYELERREQLEFEEARHTVRSSSEFVGKQADEAGQRLGVDVATDHPLLHD